MWLSVALADALARDYQNRDSIAEQLGAVEENMTPDEITEAERRAQEWTPTPER